MTDKNDSLNTSDGGLSRALLFSGQGTQYVGMGSALLSNYPQAREVIEEASEVLGFDVEQLMLEGPEKDLTSTENQQPVLLALGYAYFVVLSKLGLSFDVVAGHSLGEYTALVAAGALDYKEALKIVQYRGRFMQEAVPLGVGSMTAVIGMKAETLEIICEQVASELNQVVNIGVYNCPGNQVVSGHSEAVDEVANKAIKEGAIQAVPLSVSAPFHTPLLAPAGKRLEPHLKAAKVDPPKVEYIPNVSGIIVTGMETIRRDLVAQISRPVRWESSLRLLMETGRSQFVQLGPGRMVISHLKRIKRRVNAFAVDSPREWKKLIGELGNE